jgi:hypothetical protein
MRFANLLLLLPLLPLSGCGGLKYRTMVEKANPEKAAGVQHVTVAFVSSGMVSFGDISTKPAESADTWQIKESMEAAARESLESAGKVLDRFVVIQPEKGHPLNFRNEKNSEAVIFIGENSFCQQDCCYSGIGILMDKRKRLFQTVIEPFAMLDVVVRFRNGSEYLHAANNRNVGKFGGATAPLVDGVTFHDTLGEFPAEERERLKTALHARLKLVLNSLFTDLGFAKYLYD